MTSNSSEIGALKAAEEDAEDFEDGTPDVADEEIMEEASGSSTPNSGSLTWIAWFCTLPGHEYFVEISEDFIEDDFNLTGLNGMVPFWKEALEMVLDIEPEDSHKIPDVSIVESSAELLYGLVHQRYIITRAGLTAMHEKFQQNMFGTCPRVYCHSQAVVPCGRSDLPGLEFVRLYCPNCNDIYTPASSRYQNIDGAFFGTTFPHLFFQTYPDYMPAPFYPSPAVRAAFAGTRSPSSAGGAQQATFVNPNPYGGQKLPSARVYTPKIFGFRVSERARSGPRMRWLRARPESAAELDMVDWRGRWIGSDGFEEDDDEDQVMEDQGDEERDEEDDEEDEDEVEEEEDVPPGPPPPPSRSTKPGKRAASVQVGDDLPEDGPTLEEDDLLFDETSLPVDAFHAALYDYGEASPAYDSGYEEDDEEEGLTPRPAPCNRQAKRRFSPVVLDARTLGGLLPESYDAVKAQTRTFPSPTLDHCMPMSDSDTALDTPVEHAVGVMPSFGKQAHFTGVVVVTDDAQRHSWAITRTTYVA